MGNRGRFGKYGEVKRLNRLRRSRFDPSLSRRPARESPRKTSFHPKTWISPEAPVMIRQAEAPDAHFIRNLSGEVFGPYGHYQDVVYGWLQSEGTTTLVAVKGKRPVGFVMIGASTNVWPMEKVSEILAIGVEPDRQHTGVGRLLLMEIEANACEKGIRRLFLHTARENAPALALFQKNGYKPWGIHERFYPTGQDAVVMSKELGE